VICIALEEMETKRPWDGVEFEYPSHVPTMISKEEQRYLYWLTSEYRRGSGHVVEMGPWLGGSTVCLAAGMSAAENMSDWRLHVYDSFIWREFMAKRHALDIPIGSSFEAAFLENVKPFEHFLEVNRAVLQDEMVERDSFAMELRDRSPLVNDPVTWTSGEPVEILFVDGAKSWSGFRQLLHTFGPDLSPGGSIIVLQDFKYWGAFWVAAITELLSDRLSIEHNLRQNTVAFRVVGALDETALEVIPEWTDVSGATCDRLIRSAAARLVEIGDPAGAAVVRLSCVRMWMHKGDPDRAVSCFGDTEREWPRSASHVHVDIVRSWLENETGASLQATARTRIQRAILALRAFPRRTVRHLKKRLRPRTA
jgi:hypothetical protein